MFDFSSKLRDNSNDKIDNPLEIYEALDRASDKGPLRVSQQSVLTDWYENHKEKKDNIIKLHTGQGKTLIGLLILQSKLNVHKQPVIYFCPNKFLVEQTCEQAKQFGVKFCKVDSNNQLPQEFLYSKAILITTVQLLFNGKTKFGLKQYSTEINSLVLDDSHACIDTIQDAFTVKIKKEEKIYKEIFRLFESDLEEQGYATIEEIRQGDFDALLPVPYWAWKDKITEIVKLLTTNRDETYLLFVWDLIKDIIEDCQCIISGNSIEISPYNNPLHHFGTFTKAKHRIFMSATTSNDAFFIKGLGVDLDIIKNPIKYKDEKWSGEKMILIPYFIHHELTTPTIVSVFSKMNINRKFGIVALTPNNKKAQVWNRGGAIFPATNEIQDSIRKIKEGDYTHTLVLSNRYEGIDLPDDNCRILILDSKPISINLSDRLQESYRENSKIIDLKIAQKIEQGMGRAVRGEKDYCVIIITGISLITSLASNRLHSYFSSQTRKQIEIGKSIGQLVAEQATTNEEMLLLNEILQVSISRQDSWKKYYAQEMNSIKEDEVENDIFEILELEQKAEQLYSEGEPSSAAQKIQTLIDTHIQLNDKIERAYYLQEMARYTYSSQKNISNEYQTSAYKLNRLLLKPQYGIEFKKLVINNKRTENIIKWISQFKKFNDLELKAVSLNNDLSFGKKSDKFEKALYELGEALGFASERPDKELKKGPDNLWNLIENQYILFECKNEVKEERSEIIKEETGQMNTSCAWFKTNYGIDATKYIMIIPPKYISAAAGFNHPVEIMTKNKLNKLKSNFKSFINEFSSYELTAITEIQVTKYLQLHSLTIENILSDYTEKPVQKK